MNAANKVRHNFKNVSAMTSEKRVPMTDKSEGKVFTPVSKCTCPLYSLHTETAPAVRAAVKTVVSCVLRNAPCTGFSFAVTVQNATTENSSILRFVSKSKSL